MNAAAKPLPARVVELLRGEINADRACEPLAGLGRDFYRDGRAGRPYAAPEAPGFPPAAVEAAGRFLRACWEQGRQDSETIA